MRDALSLLDQCIAFYLGEKLTYDKVLDVLGAVMQRQMEENQKALEEKEFTAAAGGGVVEVTISGKKEVTKVFAQRRSRRSG